MNLKPIALVGGAAWAAASFAAGSAQQQIAQLHRDFARKLVAKDYAAIERIYQTRFAKDFKIVRANGDEQNLSDWLQQNRQDMAAKRAGKADGPTKLAPQLGPVRVAGSTASVLVTTKIVGEWLKDGRRMPVVGTQVMRETWVREGSVWKIKRFREVSMKGTVDGKPMRPAAVVPQKPKRNAT